MEANNQDNLSERVTVTDETSYHRIESKLGQELKSKGYFVSDKYGLRMRPDAIDDVVGILKLSPPVQKKIFGINMKFNFGPVLHIGNLDVKRYTRWVLNVYGREYLPELTTLITDMSQPYNVKLDINLVQEDPRYAETYAGK